MCAVASFANNDLLSTVCPASTSRLSFCAWLVQAGLQRWHSNSLTVICVNHSLLFCCRS